MRYLIDSNIWLYAAGGEAPAVAFLDVASAADWAGYILAGHGPASSGQFIAGYASAGTAPIYINVGDITALSQPPTFSRAQAWKGPIRCWFTRKARGIFAGCNTKGFAQQFASQALRVGAQAQGTTQSIYYEPYLIGWMGPSGYSHAKWYLAPVWQTYLGSL